MAAWAMPLKARNKGMIRSKNRSFPSESDLADGRSHGDILKECSKGMARLHRLESLCASLPVRGTAQGADTRDRCVVRPARKGRN